MVYPTGHFDCLPEFCSTSFPNVNTGPYRERLEASPAALKSVAVHPPRRSHPGCLDGMGKGTLVACFDSWPADSLTQTLVETVCMQPKGVTRVLSTHKEVVEFH